MIRLIVFTFCILCSVELFSQTAILRKDLYEQDNRTQNSTKGPGLKFYNAMFIRIGINHTIPKLDFFKTDISSIVHQSGLLGFGFYNQRKINQFLSLGINYGYQYKNIRGVLQCIHLLKEICEEKENELIEILNGYGKNISIKEIELCLKIDKTTDFYSLCSKDKKRITKNIK